MSDKPVVVCLCGSTRFKDAFAAAAREETLAGRIVLSVGLFGHTDPALAAACPACRGCGTTAAGAVCPFCQGDKTVFDQASPVKAMLDELHLRKIDLADEVLVVSECGYVGESTSREVAYAAEAGKKVRWLEPAAEAAYRYRVAAAVAEKAAAAEPAFATTHDLPAGDLAALVERLRSVDGVRFDSAVVVWEQCRALVAELDRLRASVEFNGRAGADGPQATVVYTNHRDETRIYRIRPLALRYGSTPWYHTPCWLLDVTDVDRGVDRTFALEKLRAWQDVAKAPASLPRP